VGVELRPQRTESRLRELGGEPRRVDLALPRLGVIDRRVLHAEDREIHRDAERECDQEPALHRPKR
jgi:hypothetical protein